MPIYTFRNKKTEEEFSEMMTIAEMEEYLEKNKNIGIVPAAPMIVGSVGHIDSKTDSGWKDHLNRIAEKHPTSNLAERYRRKGVKESKTKAVLEKHRKRRAGKNV